MVNTYDMRGRLGVIGDALYTARISLQSMDEAGIKLALQAACVEIHHVLAILDGPSASEPEKT